MKTNKIIVAAFALAAIVSCGKESFNGVENLPETEPAIIATGEMTKTSLNGNDIHWTSDDKIKVFDNKGGANTFSLLECDGSDAIFTGNVTAGTEQIYAVYPSVLAESANGSSLTVKVPVDQTPKVGSFAEEHNISVAKSAKTPGTELINDVTFKNVCGILKFTVPTYVSDITSVTLSSNSVIAGDMTINYSGDEPTSTISTDGSKSITMTGSYAAGSTFMFVLAPVELDGVTVNITTEKANWSISTTAAVTMEAGKYKNLGTLELEKVTAATATASHTYESNVLTGTQVKVNLNLPEATTKYITNIELAVKNSNGVIVRNYSSAAVTSEIEISANDEWPYLPQGPYTVSGTYTLSDNTTKNIAEIQFTSGQPTFKVKSNAYTSFTKYTSEGVNAANSCAPETIYNVTSASVSIADALLNNANYNKSGFSYTLDGRPAEAAEATNQTWGEHEVIASYTFDGETAKGSSECHITGLPYKMSQDAHTDRWSLGGGTARFENNNTQIVLNHSTDNNATLNFHAPTNIKIVINTERISLTCPTRFGKPYLTIYTGGSELQTFEPESGTNKTTNWYNQENSGTITASNPSLVYRRTYFAGREGYLEIYNINVNYVD